MKATTSCVDRNLVESRGVLSVEPQTPIQQAMRMAAGHSCGVQGAGALPHLGGSQSAQVPFYLEGNLFISGGTTANLF